MNDKIKLWEYWFSHEWDSITQDLKEYNHLDKIKLVGVEKEYK